MVAGPEDAVSVQSFGVFGYLVWLAPVRTLRFGFLLGSPGGLLPSGYASFFGGGALVGWVAPPSHSVSPSEECVGGEFCGWVALPRFHGAYNIDPKPYKSNKFQDDAKNIKKNALGR